MIILHCPDFMIQERAYACQIVFKEFMGMEYRLIPKTKDHWRLLVSEGKNCLILPDSFFLKAERNWLKTASLPEPPLPLWNTEIDFSRSTLLLPKLPIIFGQNNAEGKWFSRIDGSNFFLGLDVVGSAFFMLTRYEELVKPYRDEHDRFPAWASLAFQESFLNRPIIDEYVEILWQAMLCLWPNLKRRHREYSIKVSHDVDEPSIYGFKPPFKLMYALGDDIIKRKDFSVLFNAPLIRMNTKKHLHPKDPANTYEWIMDISENNGLTSTFYFICGRTNPSKDADYEPDHAAIKDLILRIYRRGHTIGLHPSYNTYNRPSLIALEAHRLRRICAEENIQQSTWGARMHYLRWQNPITLQGLEQAGIDYDDTLGYADHAGFRCGTCHEYPAFDLLERKQLQIKIRPLIVMECTVMGRRYMNLGASHVAFEKMKELKEACRNVNGCFSLLWHNTELFLPEQRKIYQNLLYI